MTTPPSPTRQGGETAPEGEGERLMAETLKFMEVAGACAGPVAFRLWQALTREVERRARILTMLREPPDEALDRAIAAMRPHLPHATTFHLGGALLAACTVLADALERQETGR